MEIDGEDVTTAIRAAEIDRLVPTVARHPEVREVMRDRQRALAVGGDSVIEGRDIGSVVAPQAEVKVFLLADADERARRRTSDRPGVAADDARRRSAKARRARCDQHDSRPTMPFSSIRPSSPSTRSWSGSPSSWRRRSEPDGRDLGGRPGDDRDGDEDRRSAPRVRGRARAAGGRPRRGGEPLQLDRPAGARRRDPANAVLHGEGRGAPRARARSAHALVRRVLRSPRRVRSRRRAHDARDRPERPCARALRRGDAAAFRCPGSRAARRSDGRDQRGRSGDLRCDLRLLRVASRELQAGVGRMGDPADLRRSPARRQGVQGGVGRDRARDQEALGMACGRPRAGPARATRLRRHDRRSRRRRDRRHGRDRRLPERREVDTDQPPDCDARHRRARDTGSHPRPQGASLRMVGNDVPPHRHGRRRSRRRRAVRPADRGAGAPGGRGSRPRPLRRRCESGCDAGRRGARRDPARVAAARARPREQARRPAPRSRGARSSTVSASATRFRSRRSTATARATSSTRS